jgi:organic hydroperoxide reductase OsmC/OhrA
MGPRHTYETTTTWTGNTGRGTAEYRSYERLYVTGAPPRPSLEGSSDPVFRGDEHRWNPELLLVASLSQCHLLSYLHRCSIAGVVVVTYTDSASGAMVQTADGGGRFEEVVLRPVVEVAAPEMVEPATALHAEASARCFIASSVSFPVRHEPVVTEHAG